MFPVSVCLSRRLSLGAGAGASLSAWDRCHRCRRGRLPAPEGFYPRGPAGSRGAREFRGAVGTANQHAGFRAPPGWDQPPRASGPVRLQTICGVPRRVRGTGCEPRRGRGMPAVQCRPGGSGGPSAFLAFLCAAVSARRWSACVRGRLVLNWEFGAGLSACKGISVAAGYGCL